MRTPIRRPGELEQANIYDALGKSERIKPANAPELRAHSQATRAEARRSRGSTNGDLGPRAMILAGYEEPGDGGEGVFLWDEASASVDDEGVTTIAIEGVAGRWKRAQLYPDQYGQLLRAPQVLTSGTTFAPLIPGRPALVEVFGGGGGGGGAGNTGATQISVGGGGGSGGYARKHYATLPASCTIAIGAAGTAGANTGGNGGAGGNTTFSDGTTTITANGGAGGVGSTAGSGAAATAYCGSSAAGGAIATNGDLNAGGTPGGSAIRLSGTVGASGPGSPGVIGGAGAAVVAQGAGGAALANSGAGGAGGLSSNAGGGALGGVGGAGRVVVWEF